MSIASSNTNRNCVKLRVVFLGDQGVGKSSIIDRYTTERYEETHSVHILASSPQLESISMSRISADTVRSTVFRCGTLLDKRDIAV